jgi:hypothetical protein
MTCRYVPDVPASTYAAQALESSDIKQQCALASESRPNSDEHHEPKHWALQTKSQSSKPKTTKLQPTIAKLVPTIDVDDAASTVEPTRRSHNLDQTPTNGQGDSPGWNPGGLRSTVPTTGLTYEKWFDQVLSSTLSAVDGQYNVPVTNHIPETVGWKTEGHTCEASNLLDIYEIMSQWAEPETASYGCWETGGQDRPKALGPNPVDH